MDAQAARALTSATEYAARELQHEIKAALRDMRVISELAELPSAPEIQRVAGGITNLLTVLGMAQRRAGELYGLLIADAIIHSEG